MIAVYSENNMNPIKALHGQNAELQIVKAAANNILVGYLLASQEGLCFMELFSFSRALHGVQKEEPHINYF
jgi:hypothetical protein